MVGRIIPKIRRTVRRSAVGDDHGGAGAREDRPLDRPAIFLAPSLRRFVSLFRDVRGGVAAGGDHATAAASSAWFACGAPAWWYHGAVLLDRRGGAGDAARENLCGVG